MKRNEIEAFLTTTFQGLDGAALPGGAKMHSGKVRDIVDLGARLLIITTDRISAFDRVLTTIPCKGDVLNRLSLYWFDKTKDIIPNHVIGTATPRSMLVRKGTVIPIEVVVRGYLTGSAWRDYKAGKAVSGIALPAGMRMNQRFETPLLTPSTKEEQGEHDRPISSAEVVSEGRVDAALWGRIEAAAVALFNRGSDMLAERGLILVDTKYEFALIDGALTLVDEIHTPDSSRFWYADTYRELFAAEQDQRKIDKEYLRSWLAERGFMGDGDAPAIPDEVRIETAWRYIQAFEGITGRELTVEARTPEAEREKILSLLS